MRSMVRNISLACSWLVIWPKYLPPQIAIHSASIIMSSFRAISFNA